MNYDKKLKAAERLLEVMDTLREKCPWDREQTFESLRNNTIEETFELVDAIADGIVEALEEKLGEKPRRVEGKTNAAWIAVDYVDVMVHIFLTPLRDYYRLEQLWADAPATRYESEE